jgi:SAM-dependent MidA family methyltransferase
LKAFKEHKLADVFLQPGDCDLTADVDFLFLKHIAEKSNSKSHIFLYFYSKI